MSKQTEAESAAGCNPVPYPEVLTRYLAEVREGPDVSEAEEVLVGMVETFVDAVPHAADCEGDGYFAGDCALCTVLKY